MLLLFLDALLLIFITINLGILVHAGLSKLLGCTVQSDPLGIFLMGLIVTTIYLNMISFWLPPNYLALAPLAAISLVMVTRRREKYRPLLFSAHAANRLVRSCWLPAVCVFLLLIFYWIKPPTNPDSVGYHYLSILWYEKYKVVPGLANLNGRFAFNPASFIVQSAYSFSQPAGQAIYPLNGVITAIFLLWILVRMIRHRNSLSGLAYLFLMFIFSRLLLGNMASPASDPLAQVCLGYAVMRLLELMLARQLTVPKLINLCLILLYAPIVKLSAYPAILILLFVCCLIPRRERKPPVLMVLFTTAILIYLPWTIRNFIMCGYLVYPFPFPGFFHPDWKVPSHVLTDEYSQIKYGPRIYLAGLAKGKGLIEFFLFAAALLSPLLWIAVYAKKIRPWHWIFFLWLIIYGAVWLWLIGSPDYRFGTVILVISFMIPIMLLATVQKPGWTRTIANTLPAFFVIFTLYYFYGVFTAFATYAQKKEHFFSWKEGILRPLRHVKYATGDRKAGFPYKTLSTGVKLYLGDSTHSCINADMPCLSPGATEIEMRGDCLDDGFRPVSSGP